MGIQKQPTQTFSIQQTRELEMRQALKDVYAALAEKAAITGKEYNPIDQIVGYIVSEDPTYITNYKNARSIIRKIDIYELLNELVRNYLGH